MFENLDFNQLGEKTLQFVQTVLLIYRKSTFTLMEM